MKKKAIYASLLFLILVIGFYIYNAFNGNPISRSLAEKKLEAYLQETHHGENLNIKESFYNFKYAEYVIHVTDQREDEYIFSVKGGFRPAVTNDGINEAREEKTRARISKEASEEMKSQLEKSLKNVMDVEVSLSGSRSFKESAEWKKLKQTEMIDVTVTLNTGRDSQKQVYKQAKAVKKALKDYHYENIEINGMGLDGEDRPGYVKYSVCIEKGSEIALEDVQLLAKS
ncbi:hypothetical protein P4U97_12270 [Bacillus swezeyi]|uniref:YfjL-like protein n=1 Tax=Bacillus swezeyi TaxID=1925020 RepID=UPI002E204028|nr:hypothetical protein [Bacillus swezeyi]